MKYLISILLLSVITLWTSCSNVPPVKVKAEIAKNVDFSKYKSYKFMDEISFSDRFDNHASENRRNVENFLHAVLSSTGMTETEIPDLFVNYYTIVENATDVIEKKNYRKGKYGGMEHVDKYIVNYEKGTLIVDLVDSRSKKLVYHGVVMGVLSDNPKDSKKELGRAVAALAMKIPVEK